METYRVSIVREGTSSTKCPYITVKLSHPTDETVRTISTTLFKGSKAYNAVRLAIDNNYLPIYLSGEYVHIQTDFQFTPRTRCSHCGAEKPLKATVISSENKIVRDTVKANNVGIFITEEKFKDKDIIISRELNKVRKWKI